MKAVLLRKIPSEQQTSPRDVASLRLVACGKELKERDTLQKIVVAQGVPKNVHVGVVKVSEGQPMLLIEGLEPRKPTHRLCCSQCVLS